MTGEYEQANHDQVGTKRCGSDRNEPDREQNDPDHDACRGYPVRSTEMLALRGELASKCQESPSKPLPHDRAKIAAARATAP